MYFYIWCKIRILLDFSENNQLCQCHSFLKSHPFYISVIYWFLCVPGFISRLSLLLLTTLCLWPIIYLSIVAWLVSCCYLEKYITTHCFVYIFLPILRRTFFFRSDLWVMFVPRPESHWKSDRICVKYTCINYGKIGISVIVNLLSEKLMCFSLWVF